MEDLFKDTTFGKLALTKIKPASPNFRLYSAGWLGNGSEREVMEVTGAEFREAKRGPRKGEMCIQVPGTVRTVHVRASEIVIARASKANAATNKSTINERDRNV